MGAAILPSTDVPADSFWDRLRVLEAQHQSLQHEQDRLCRALDEATLMQTAEDLRETWKRYSQVIAELDDNAEKFGTLRPDLS